MTDRAKKITELDSLTNTSVDDLLLIVDNPGNSSLAETKSITVGDFFSRGIGANTANTAYANAVIFANTIANTAYANAVAAANTMAAAAYSNSVTYIISAANTAYVNAITVANSLFTNSVTNWYVGNSYVFRANTVQILRTQTPANSIALEIDRGVIFYDQDYLYIATAANTIKRVAITDF